MEKVFLNLAGEFLVAAELNRRNILCSVTYGPSKSADVFAFTETTGRVLRIEVKTTTKKHWPVGGRGLSASANDKGQMWVLVWLPPPLDSQPNDEAERGKQAPRFFVLKPEEVGELARANHDAYCRTYRARHGKEFTALGIHQVTLAQAAEHEAQWGKIQTAIRS